MIMFKERVDGDEDILGLAAANAAAAVTGAFVVNGSPTQTAMAYQAGAPQTKSGPRVSRFGVSRDLASPLAPLGQNAVRDATCRSFQGVASSSLPSRAD
jgi:hypothetical protein